MGTCGVAKKPRLESRTKLAVPSRFGRPLEQTSVQQKGDGFFHEVRRAYKSEDDDTGVRGGRPVHPISRRIRLESRGHFQNPSCCGGGNADDRNRHGRRPALQAVRGDPKKEIAYSLHSSREGASRCLNR